MEYLAPMSEQIGTLLLKVHHSPETSLKCIVMVQTCSGMGEANLKF